MGWSDESSIALSPPQPPTSAAPLTPEDLAEVMLTCTQVTEHLHAAHQVLQAEVRRLNSELRETNEQLHRARHLAALGQMAAGIAHEVRNPLGSIRLYASMLADDLTDRPDAQQLAQRIDRAVTDLDAIVGDVLNFSRELTIQPVPVSPSDVIRQALSVCADLLKHESIRIVINDDETQCVAGDANLLSQALCNILRNAVEAIREANGSLLQIDVESITLDDDDPTRNESPTDHIAITVRDDGHGIAPEVMDRIFNPFFTTRKAGTGLGLAIVHRIADAHAGQVRIETNQPRGTALSLILPVIDDRSDRSSPTESQS